MNITKKMHCLTSTVPDVAALNASLVEMRQGRRAAICEPAFTERAGSAPFLTWAAIQENPLTRDLSRAAVEERFGPPIPGKGADRGSPGWMGLRFAPPQRLRLATMLRGVQRYRDDFKAVADVDPLHFSTPAATTVAAYEKSFMPAKSLPNITEIKDRSSLWATEYTTWLRSEGREIRSALDGGEVKIGRFKVDNLEAATKTVFEFHGCRHHECLECFGGGPKYKATQERKQWLEDQGYTVEEMWAHDWRKKRETPEVQAAIAGVDAHSEEPCLGRNALKAALNPVCWAEYVCQDGERIEKVDFDSMYGDIMRTELYPADVPELVSGDTFNLRLINGLCRAARPAFDALALAEIQQKPFEELQELRDSLRGTLRSLPFGVMKVRLTPPKGAWSMSVQLDSDDGYETSDSEEEPPEDDRIPHPLIPIDGQYCFRTGVVEECTPILYRAVSVGYTITKIYSARISKEQRSDLFKDFVEAFWRRKCEASGFPRPDMTAEERQDYVEQIEAQTGIRPDLGTMERYLAQHPPLGRNEGMRALAKAPLVCLWGKLSPDPEKLATRQVSRIARTIAEKWEIRDNPRYADIKAVDYGRDALMMFCEERRARNRFSQHNPYIGAFTTMYGRLRLWERMNYLGNQFLYGHTDSALYVTGPGRKRLPCGIGIGQFKDDLPAGRHGTAFVSTGHNSYVLRLDDGTELSRYGGVTGDVSLEDARRIARDDSETLTLTEPRKVTLRNRLAKLGRIVEHGPGRTQILPHEEDP